jgi:hypothetical protein
LASPAYAEPCDLDISDLAAQVARASVSRAIESGVDGVPERP